MLSVLVTKLQKILEDIDQYRDRFLFLFIKPYWPRKISPNHVTSVRIIISLVLFFLIFLAKNHDKSLIITLFVIGALTDLIDGPIARSLNKVTELGAMLDAVSDRMLLLPIAVYSLLAEYQGLLFILIFAEFINAVASSYYKSREIYLESNIFGKTKMFLMCFVFIAMLIVFPRTPPTVFIYMLWLTIPLSLLSIFAKVNELMSKQRAKT